jgi:hypothetical protein
MRIHVLKTYAGVTYSFLAGAELLELSAYLFFDDILRC